MSSPSTESASLSPGTGYLITGYGGKMHKNRARWNAIGLWNGEAAHSPIIAAVIAKRYIETSGINISIRRCARKD